MPHKSKSVIIDPGLVPLNPLLLIGFGIVVGVVAFLAGCLIS